MRSYTYFALILLATACGDSSKTPDARVRSDGNNNGDPDAPGTVDATPVDGPVPQGCVHPGARTPTADTRIWITGDVVTDNARKSVTFLGSATLPISNPTQFPAMGVHRSNVVPFALSPDGTKVAYVADSTTAGRFDLFIADADGANPASVFAAAMNDRTIKNLVFSPDGSKIAFIYDADLVGQDDLYVVAASANATPKKLSPARATASADLDVFGQVTWSPDSRHIAFSIEATENGFDEAALVDTTTATPTPVFVIPRTEIVASSSDARGTRGAPAFDSNCNVYYRARIAADGVFRLYRAPITATSSAQRTESNLGVMRADNTTPSVGPFGISPDGTKLVVTLDAPTLDVANLYSMTTANFANPTKITNNVLANRQLRAATPLRFSPDGTKVAYVAGFEQGANDEPRVATLGSLNDVRLVAVTGQSQTAEEWFAWSQDSQSIFWMGDFLVNNETFVAKLSATTPTQTPTNVIMGQAAGGDVFQLVAGPKP